MRSVASGARGAAEAEILKWLFVWQCPPYWRSKRASEEDEVQAVEVIKRFDIFGRIASVRCRC
jgi:hypothetical protein